MAALQWTEWMPVNLACCMFRACSTRLRMTEEDSPFSMLASSSYPTAGTSIWMSMRSKSGPEILLR